MGKKLVIILGIIGILASLGLSRLLLSMREAGGGIVAGTRPGSLTYRLERLDEAIAGLDAVEPALPKVAGEFAALEKENALAAALAPDGMDFAATEKYLIDISRKAGVDLASITPEDEPAGIAGNLEAWRVHVVIAGSFDQLAAFVDAAENPAAATTPRLIDVADLAVSGDTADGYHECRLVLQLYRYEDDGVTPEDPPTSGLAEMLAAARSAYAPGGRDPMRMRQGEAAEASEEPAPAPSPLPEPSQPEAPEPTIPEPEAPAPEAPEAPVLEAPVPEAPAPPLPDDSPEEASLPGLRVDGISWSPDEPRAVVNGAIYRIGDSVAGMDGLRIESILPKAVVFDHNGERIRVPVRMFGREEIR